ncbi:MULTISPECIES: SH3 domain-containing protein [Thermoanaerobacterium]|uniref:NLP/P60 protein n=2 Tax=Thermoanaerobacterium TaxID=28895 RepID=W9E9P7_9THEO|nr:MULTISPECIES: SH3 domain-containing protein [Thermoanaerobacterium]AFK87660.1 NLP/P60 protein [Thermoanaerobacterium saccharolyticum JW/SL-YS485]ETO37595.1 NLP/P60 protein [Thermoanaerobacterium aotearoense SCUT27]
MGVFYIIPDTRLEMLEADYWIEKISDADCLIMTQDDIMKFNREIVEKCDSVYDLRSYRDSLTYDELLSMIKEYKLPEKEMYFKNGEEVKRDFYHHITDNLNITEIKEVNPVRYGITIRKTYLRSFPTDIAVYSRKGDIEFDRFQETSCQAIEPVLVLHESKDGRWYFIQMYNYRGWAKAADIAIAKDKEEVFGYVDTDDFIVVTGNHVKTQYNPYDRDVSEIQFDMGTKIPLEKDIPNFVANQSTYGNYVVKLPSRDDNGNLVFKDGLISIKEDVHWGYVPYTRANVLNQAFKLIGDRYGWGDSFDGRDCSSFIMYVYKTFGFKLPRNADEQERCPGRVHRFFDGMSLIGRIEAFKGIKPGAALYMPGHAMMYVGMDDEVPYIVHDFAGYGAKNGEEYEFIPVNEVMVTSSLLPTSNGIPFIERITSAIQFEK